MVRIFLYYSFVLFLGNTFIMCLQCLAQARIVVENVFGGVHLMQSTVNVPGWPLGHYGLTSLNDPFVVFPGPLLRDPFEGLTEEEGENVPEALWQAYRDAGQAIGKALVLPALKGADLVRMCEESGYDREEDGDVQWWLMNYLARKTQEQGGMKIPKPDMCCIHPHSNLIALKSDLP